ncbi:MAG TPA: hypothetical protein VJ400_00630 [Thermoplasmata archaeon]|nr:hypothetical protein [Thermoplasmata archaeon]
MTRSRPSPGVGRVNGLARPRSFSGRRPRLPVRAPLSIVAAGGAVYGIALAFPVLFRQVSVPVIAAAILGTALVLVGLHVRWTWADPLRN